MTEAYVTLEHQWCCVTLAGVENMLIRLCAGISIHGIATEDLSVNLANKDCELPFDILLACLDKLQGSSVPNETLFSLFSKLAVKIRQHFLNLNNSRAKLNKIFSTVVSVAQHHCCSIVTYVSFI